MYLLHQNRPFNAKWCQLDVIIDRIVNERMLIGIICSFKEHKNVPCLALHLNIANLFVAMPKSSRGYGFCIAVYFPTLN